MFCVQCEQTIRTPAGNGCSYAQGMCGKTAETSDLQDLLIASLQGLSAWALKAREYGIIDHQVDSFAPRAFFSTLTNVNFDSPRIVGYARQAIALREALKAQCLAIDASAAVDSPVADLQLVSDDLGDLQRQAADYTPNKDKAAIGENILGLPLKTGLAMASGFGWYSLSGILLTESFGPVIGSAAFFNDLCRELLAIMLIPGLIRRSRSTALGLCGATSMDFTLPVLQRSGGVEIVPAAIVHGFLLSLLVPILIAFFTA